jgi:hypothetical protein
MINISQAAIDEVGRVSEAVARAEREPTREFRLQLILNTDAFGDDSFDREMEVARILRAVSDSLYSNALVSESASLKDRNGQQVGRYDFLEYK